MHFIVALKVKRGLTSISKAEPEHAPLMGHMLIVAARVAETLGCGEDGYRVVINDGLHAGLSIEHFFLHVIGGK
jgi:diadenosine tetraphosphate (Ap4A) HIT family hydrolase